MKRVLFLGAATAVTVLVTAASALAVTLVEFSVKTSPGTLKTSTATKVAAGLTLAGSVTPDPGALQPFVSDLKINLNDAWGINAKAIDNSCSSEKLEENGSCSSGTLFATGEAIAEIAELKTLGDLNATFKVYSVKPTGGSVASFALYARTTSPVETTINVPANVKVVGGKPVIQVAASDLPKPFGYNIRIKRISAKTKVGFSSKIKGIKTPALYTPKTCKNGKFTYTSTQTFEDPAGTSTSEASSPCKQSKK